jgi:ribosome-associated protein
MQSVNSCQRRLKLSRTPAPGAKLGAETVEQTSSEGVGSTPLARLILKQLDDDQAQDIVVIDLNERSSVADGLIIASGRSHRHVGAITDHLLRALKDGGYGRAKTEGLPHCDWVLVDAGDVIVHLFRPEVRDFYNIEKIWSVDSSSRSAIS